MRPFHFLCLLLPVSIGLTAPAGAQHTTRYDAAGFEAPRFVAGRLAARDMISGQDGWLSTGDAYTDANLDAVLVQSTTVRTGRQAVAWDASLEASSYCHLRTNVQFQATADLFDIEIDMYLASSATPSDAWGLDVQSAPMARVTKWIVRPSGAFEVLTSVQGVAQWIQTGATFPRDAWHRVRMTVDTRSLQVDFFIDDQLVIAGVDLAFPLAYHAFTSVFLGTPGDDRCYFDNFVIRERARAPTLTLDVDRLSAATGDRVRLFIDGGASLANRRYLVIASATGTTPGLVLPNGVVAPIVVDSFTDAVLFASNGPVFQNFTQLLNPYGLGQAQIDLPIALPSALIGFTMHFTWVSFAPIDAAANAVTLTIVP